MRWPPRSRAPANSTDRRRGPSPTRADARAVVLRRALAARRAVGPLVGYQSLTVVGADAATASSASSVATARTARPWPRSWRRSARLGAVHDAVAAVPGRWRSVLDDGAGPIADTIDVAAALARFPAVVLVRRPLTAPRPRSGEDLCERDPGKSVAEAATDSPQINSRRPSAHVDEQHGGRGRGAERARRATRVWPSPPQRGSSPSNASTAVRSRSSSTGLVAEREDQHRRRSPRRTVARRWRRSITVTVWAAAGADNTGWARRSRSISVVAASTSRCGDRRASVGSSTAPWKVSTAAGSAMGRSQPASVNSAARPVRVAARRSGSPWSTKNGNGAGSAYSSPMNSSGVNGPRVTVAVASTRCARLRAGRRPSGVLPTWSWFDEHTISCRWSTWSADRPCVRRRNASTGRRRPTVARRPVARSPTPS